MKYIKTTPEMYAKQLKRMMEINGATLIQVAEKLGMTVESLKQACGEYKFN